MKRRLRPLIRLFRRLTLLIRARRFIRKLEAHDSVNVYVPIVVGQTSKKLVANKGDIRTYLMSRNRQHHKLLAFARQCRELDVRVLVDVGANYGEFCVLLESDFKVIAAIEPNPLVVSCLKRSISLTQRSNDYRVFENACVASSPNRADHASFVIDTSYSGGNHLQDDVDSKSVAPFLPWGQVCIIDVKTIPLSRVISETQQEALARGCSGGLAIKIDVEGAEVELLRDLRFIYTNSGDWRQDPQIIMFEFNSNSFSRTDELVEVVRDLVVLGFSCGHIPNQPTTTVDQLPKILSIRDIQKVIYPGNDCEILLRYVPTPMEDSDGGSF